jgi:rubrerythrin
MIFGFLRGNRIYAARGAVDKLAAEFLIKWPRGFTNKLKDGMWQVSVWPPVAASASMICGSCGKHHENLKGTCPFCAVPTRIVNRQRERPAEILGSIFECRNCGQEITKWKKVKVYHHGLSGPFFEDEIPDHTCPEKPKPQM